MFKIYSIIKIQVVLHIQFDNVINIHVWRSSLEDNVQSCRPPPTPPPLFSWPIWVFILNKICTMFWNMCENNFTIFLHFYFLTKNLILLKIHRKFPIKIFIKIKAKKIRSNILYFFFSCNPRLRLLWDCNSNQIVLGYYWLSFLNQSNVSEYLRKILFCSHFDVIQTKYVSEYSEKSQLKKFCRYNFLFFFKFRSKK